MNLKTIYGTLLQGITLFAGIGFAKKFDARIRFHRKLNLKNPVTLADKVSYNTILHRKTYDLLTLLYAKGVNRTQVYRIFMHYKKKFKPVIGHWPELIVPILPQGLCKNLGYNYPEIQEYEEIGLEEGELDALKWAIYEGETIGVTTHIIGREIDAGEIIKTKIVCVYENNTFHRVCARFYENEIKVLAGW